MIEVKHLEKYYGSDGTVTKALDDISFISYDGEFLCIMELPVPEKARF